MNRPLTRDIKEIIQQRIYQILVHSAIYYDFNTNIVDDFKYDDWGKELQQLVKDYPKEVEQCHFGEYFKTYSETSSGFDLPFRHPLIRCKAERLLIYKKHWDK